MTKQNHLFISEQLSVLCDIFEPQLNFDTPVISAVFKPKMENITDEKWAQAMDILHPVLPLQSVEYDGEMVYAPVYSDEETLDKSVSIYVALREYKREQKRPKAPSDLYCYGSAMNKEFQMRELNKFFNVVRFSKGVTGPFWYALEVAIPNEEERGYALLSDYISPRRMKIDNPIWVGDSHNYPSGSIICYDFGSEKDYRFFSKIAADLEEYQKQQSEYDTGAWEPRHLLAYKSKISNERS